MSPSKLIVLTILLMSGTEAFAQEEEIYLSQNDKGYDYIEARQAQLCKLRPTLNCSITYKECKEKIKSISKRVFNQMPNDSIIKCHCSRISTKYEVRGGYIYLLSLYDEIERAAKQLNFQLATKPKLGTLPIKQINASSEENGYSVIFINSTFMTFANEIMKVVSQSISTKSFHSNSNFNDDDRIRDLNNALTSKPNLLKDFLITIVAHVEGNPNHPHDPPNEKFAPLITDYLRGIELFAMAHEYGHIFMKHTKNNTHSLIMDDGTVLSNSSSKNNGEELNENGWSDELVADYIAMAILKQISLNDINDHKSNSNLSILTAPEYYFTSIRLLANARMIMYGQKSDPTVNWEMQSLMTIKKTLSDTSPNSIQLKLNDLPPIKLKSKPPTDLIRQKIVHDLLSNSDGLDKSNSGRLNEILIKNTLDLWEIAAPELAKLVRD